MERTTQFLSLLVNDRLREARCRAEHDRLVREALLARRAARRTGNDEHPTLRASLGATLVQLGARIAGGTAELRPRAETPCVAC
jgi:hypothetical protein